MTVVPLDVIQPGETNQPIVFARAESKDELIVFLLFLGLLIFLLDLTRREWPHRLGRNQSLVVWIVRPFGLGFGVFLRVGRSQPQAFAFKELVAYAHSENSFSR